MNKTNLYAIRKKRYFYFVRSLLFLACLIESSNVFANNNTSLIQNIFSSSNKHKTVHVDSENKENDNSDYDVAYIDIGVPRKNNTSRPICAPFVKTGKRTSYNLSRDDLNFLEFRFCEDLMKVDFKKPFSSGGIPFEKMNFDGARYKKDFSHPVEMVLLSKLLESGEFRAIYRVKATKNGEIPFEKEELILNHPTGAWGNINYTSGLVITPRSKYGHIPYSIVKDQDNRNYELSFSYLENALDWESIIDIDREAKSTWDKYVQSMKAKGIFSSKDIRKHYFNSGYKNKIFHDFRRSLITFLGSSALFPTYGLSMIENFHPFFVQTLIELSYKYKEFIRINYEMRTQSIFNRTFGESGSVGEIDGHTSYTFLLLNIISSNDKACLNLGLSPEFSRLVFQFNFSSDILDHMLASTRYNITKSCGDFYDHKFLQYNLSYYNVDFHREMGRKVHKKFNEIGTFLIENYH